MTLQEKIDALPEWPVVSAMQKWPDAYSAEIVRQERERHHYELARAALARLALARDAITELRMWLINLAPGELTKPCADELAVLLAALECPP